MLRVEERVGVKRAIAILFCLVLGVGAGLVAFALATSGWSFAAALARLGTLRIGGEPAAVPDAPASVEPVMPSSTPAVSASAPAAVLGEPAASATPAASTAPSSPAIDPAADPSTCLHALFSRDAFVRKAPSLKFVCTATDAKKLVARLRVAIVDASGGHVSDSMKEWSLFGYYELATIALLRGRCCADPAALELPPGPSGCAPLSERLAAITAASQPGAAEADLDAALAAFDAAARCVGKSERPTAYGYGVVGPGEASAFDKTRRRPQR